MTLGSSGGSGRHFQLPGGLFLRWPFAGGARHNRNPVLIATLFDADLQADSDFLRYFLVVQHPDQLFGRQLPDHCFGDPQRVRSSGLGDFFLPDVKARLGLHSPTGRCRVPALLLHPGDDCGVTLVRHLRG